MIMTEKSKQHIDSCRFCWMCRHICPIGNATGQERNTARARALGLSLVNRGAAQLEDVIDNIYECATCGACTKECVTGWDPVMFTKETRLLAAMEGKTPAYINELIDNCLDTGNAYGKKEIAPELSESIARHAENTEMLFFLGTDARYQVPQAAVKAIAVMELCKQPFTVLENEPASGAQLEFLVGAAEETKAQMAECAKALSEYKTVVVFDPVDVKAMKRTYQEYGLECEAKLVTFTEYLEGADLALKHTAKTVSYQDPFQLSRDLGETEEARSVIAKCADLKEMLLNRRHTMWAGDLLMAQYLPDTIRHVSLERIANAQAVGVSAIVTASVGEYAALKAVAPDDFSVISLEELVLSAAQ